MKKTTLLLALLSLVYVGKGQNLVPNPSFEDYYSCPILDNEVYKCQYWSSYGRSPDYFNSCSPDTLFSVPSNCHGYQTASSGNAYCGFYNYSAPGIYNEYLGAQLLQPLIIGQKYFVSFKVSPSTYFYCPSNKMGARFTNIIYDSINPPPIDEFAHVYTDSIVMDTSLWYQVKGSFISDSNYIYIMIGNFFYNTSYYCGALNFASYYYLEDICVSPDSLTCYSATGISENPQPTFTIYPNPAGEEFTVEGLKFKEEIKIYDVLGKQILHSAIQTPQSAINISSLKSRIYFVEINNVRKKLIKQ